MTYLGNQKSRVPLSLSFEENTMTVDDESAGALDGRRLAVLVDDDPLVLKGLALVLEQLGWDVVAVESVEDALARLAAQNKAPSLIIADYRLRAGHTGVEAILSIRDRCGAAVPAFLLTGDTYPERLREALKSGFALLHKPVSFRELNSQLLAVTAD